MSKLTFAEHLAHTTVRLECDLRDGGTSTGTGFFFQFALDGSRSVPAIITNKHVIADAVQGRFCLTKCTEDGLPQIGSTVPVTRGDFQSLWTPHPDPDIDLCAMPIEPVLAEVRSRGTQIFYAPLATKVIPSDTDLAELDLLENVTMVGYPNGLWDRVNNMPVFRTGATATHPALDWNGKPEFMIDAACFPGSSGSPVFLFDRGGFIDRQGVPNFTGSTRFKLLGVLYAGPIQTADGEITVVPVPAAQREIVQTGIPMHLGFVIKARMLLAFEEQFRQEMAAG